MALGATHVAVRQVNDTLILITLLVELGVAAAFSSSLARSNTFKTLLLLPRRNLRQTLAMVAMICIPLTLGVWIRVRVANFLAADISFEAIIILALVLGTRAALLGGAILALPALSHGEYWALPVNLLIALIAGGDGDFPGGEGVLV